MNNQKVEIEWPNGYILCSEAGSDWLDICKEAGIDIPTGCLKGSCGACEIEVNGKVLRACIHNIYNSNEKILKVDLFTDPFWD